MNDQQMGEMEPPDTFTLTLRGYQKQALLYVLKSGGLFYLANKRLRWMHSLENGEASARDAISMHPLWSQ